MPPESTPPQNTAPFDPMMGRLEVIEPGLAMFHGFANVAFAYGRGEMMAVDTSSRAMGALAVAAIREVSSEPVGFIVYSHGHGDHAFGTEAFIRDAASRGHMRPKIWAQENIHERFRRYARTRGWQRHINQLQFGRAPMLDNLFSDDSFQRPDLTFRDYQSLDLLGEPVEIHHARGETDDAAWVWMPARRVAMVGDLIVNSLPNTGNPNKVQRYTLEWAQALEAIALKRPRLILPGHGPIVSGENECAAMLTDTATAMRFIHDEVVARLNRGEWPAAIVEANIQLPAELARKAYLAPIYGCVAFIVRDVIRRYAGWWSGEPSMMFPASREERAVDLIAICGRERILEQARKLMNDGKLQRALAMVEIATNAEPVEKSGIELNAQVLDRIAANEPSFIARNFFAGAARELRARTKSA